MNDQPLSKVLVLDNSPAATKLIKRFCLDNNLVPLKVRKGSVMSVLRTNVDLGGILFSEGYGETPEETMRVALEIHSARPELPIIGLTPVARTAQRLSLVWGVETVLTGDPEDLADMVRKACTIALEEGFVRAGDGVVITCGVPLGTAGATNMIRLAFVDEFGLPDGHSPDYVPVGGKVPQERRVKPTFRPPV